MVREGREEMVMEEFHQLRGTRAVIKELAAG